MTKFIKYFISLILIIAVLLLFGMNFSQKLPDLIYKKPVISEPITIDECEEIYYNNKKNFEVVKDYMLSLDDNVSIHLKDLDYDNKIKSEVKPYFSNLKNCRVKNINKSKYNDNFEYTVITFYIDGTESSKYGIVWKNNSQEFYTAENKLDENWYSYFIGYT